MQEAVETMQNGCIYDQKMRVNRGSIHKEELADKCCKTKHMQQTRNTQVLKESSDLCSIPEKDEEDKIENQC